MRAILIDPVEKKIEEIDVKHPNIVLDEFYDIIGTDLVEMVYLDRNIVMVIDEYGRLKDIKGAFKFLGCDDLIIAGKAVVMGNRISKFTALKEDKRSFEMIVEWVDPEDVPEPEFKIMSF
jgi:hypothetical protein